MQLLTDLLFTVPFQARFTGLAPHDRAVYLVTVALSVLATGALIAPVVLHRMPFRLHARRVLALVGHAGSWPGSPHSGSL